MVLRCVRLTLCCMLAFIMPAWSAELTLVPLDILNKGLTPVALGRDGTLAGFRTVPTADHVRIIPWIRFPDGQEQIPPSPTGGINTGFAAVAAGLAVGTAREAFSCVPPCVSLPFRWSLANGFTLLPLPDGHPAAFARAVNATGTIAGAVSDVALGRTRPVVWLADGPLVLSAETGEALAINSAGVVVGHAGRHATRWTAEGPLTLETEAFFSVAQAINDHGTITGMVQSQSGRQDAFVWLEETGFLLLPALPGAQQTQGRIVTDDGTIYGTSGVADRKILTPVRWRTVDGTVVVQPVAELVEAPGWRFLDLLVGSDHGLVMLAETATHTRQVVLLAPTGTGSAGR